MTAAPAGQSSACTAWRSSGYSNDWTRKNTANIEIAPPIITWTCRGVVSKLAKRVLTMNMPLIASTVIAIHTHTKKR